MIISRHLQDKRRLYGDDSQKCPFCLLVHLHNTSRQLLCLKPPQSHKQLLPLSLSFGVSLLGAPGRAATELLEAGVGWCQCPHGSVPQVPVSLLRVWLLQVISPSPTPPSYPTAPPSYPTAPPRMSPGWSEQGSLFPVVAINSTTTSISLRYQAISSSRSQIVISDNKTKGSKGKREY